MQRSSVKHLSHVVVVHEPRNVTFSHEFIVEVISQGIVHYKLVVHKYHITWFKRELKVIGTTNCNFLGGARTNLHHGDRVINTVVSIVHDDRIEPDDKDFRT
ncbi:hypothetical protein D9M73_217340 [compost metagenome]